MTVANTRMARISSANLYRDFRHYEDEMYPSFRKTDKIDWDHEMKRLQQNQPEAMKFEKGRRGNGSILALVQCSAS